MSNKMRCARCGKTFKPARSNQTLCDQCEKQERAARALARSSGATASHTTTTSAQPVRIVGPAANLLDPHAVASTNAPPPETGLYGSAAIREEQRREQQRREEQRHAEERARDEQRAQERAQRYAEARPHDGRHDHHDHQGQQRVARPPRAERPASPPRPPRPPRSAVPQFVMTDELRSQIEARYLELAQPVEFDGIRTRIATELSVPKSHVKQVVAALRSHMQLPSWWDLQAYSGAETDLERIRMAYLPHLPVPDVGIHKTLADELQLDPRTVYQGIRRIRAEMRLPQYNAPELHGDAPGSASDPAAPAPSADAAAESETHADQTEGAQM
ncbi:MAG: hypothetical protein ACRDID_13550 [Ktedonobacterales bacterium]